MCKKNSNSLIFKWILLNSFDFLIFKLIMTFFAFLFINYSNPQIFIFDYKNKPNLLHEYYVFRLDSEAKNALSVFFFFIAHQEKHWCAVSADAPIFIAHQVFRFAHQGIFLAHQFFFHVRYKFCLAWVHFFLLAHQVFVFAQQRLFLAHQDTILIIFLLSDFTKKI